MTSMTTKMDAISLALMLRPSSVSHAGWWRTPSGWSVSGMDRHRNFRANSGYSRYCPQVRLLLGKDRQVVGDKSKDGEAECDEHGRDDDFCPLRGVACSDCVFYAGDGDIQTVGDKSQQRENGNQVESLGAVTYLGEQQEPEREDERQAYLQQEEALFIAPRKDKVKNTAMEEVFEAQDSINGEYHHQHPTHVAQDRKFELAAEVLGTHRRLEDDHGKTNCNRRNVEEHGQQGTVPESVQLVGHDQIERAQRGLVQGGEKHAKDDQHDHHAADRFQGALPTQVFEQYWRKFQRQNRGVEHHAVGNFEHHRVGIAHDERMPDVPRQTKVIHERGANQQVAHESGQDGRPHNGMPAFDIEDFYRRCQGEATGSQHDAAHHVEADPKTPGKLVAQVGRRTQSVTKANVGGIDAGHHDDEKDALPEGET